MAMLIKEMINKYNYVMVDLGDPRMRHLPLMASPWPGLAIIGAYIYFVTSLGPRLMQHRQPFNLDRVVQVYNAVQIVLAVWLVERSITLAWAGKYNWFCQPVDYSLDPEALEVARCVYAYFLIKIVDLLDTVFFVLRKKNNQITFLHVYHHAGMVATIWGGCKYLPGGHGTFVGFINSIVHAVMYSYYLVTSLYPQYKNNIWWKKHITQLQMVQFLMITMHSAQLLVQPDCQYPKFTAGFMVPQNAFMFALFYDFYRKAYFPKKDDSTAKTQ